MSKAPKDMRRSVGRPKGSPNISTLDARKAIAAFVQGNTHRLEHWLDLVANGQPEYETKPNPAKAFELLLAVLEFSIPKLNRTEVTHEVKQHVSELSDADLLSIAMSTSDAIEDIAIKQESEKVPVSQGSTSGK
jgi:hypothetical protein